MAIYVEFDKDGNAVAERNYNPPLDPTDIPLIDGEPVLRELSKVENEYKADEQKPIGWVYEVLPDGTVAKVVQLADLTDDEKQDKKAKQAIEARSASLPPFEEGFETLLRIVKITLDRQLMTETREDPRTKVGISQQGYNEVMRLLALCEANPLPASVKIEGADVVKPQDQADPQRTVEMNIFHNRVESIMADETQSQAVRDAFGQLVKLIG